MKLKKTFKSLAELSTDSFDAVHSEPEKTKPPEPKVLVEAPRNVPPDSFPRVPDLRRHYDWGINE